MWAFLTVRNPEKYHSFGSVREKFLKSAAGRRKILTGPQKQNGGVLYEIENKHSGKIFLIVSHEYPVWLMFSEQKERTSKNQ